MVLLEALACLTTVVSIDCSGTSRDIMAIELTPEALAAHVDAVLDTEGFAIKERWLDRFFPAQIISPFSLEIPAS